MPRRPRTPAESARERDQQNARRRARRELGIPARPERTAAELESNRIRSRRKTRILAGWPESWVDLPPIVRAPAPARPRMTSAPDVEIRHPLIDQAIANLTGSERFELGGDFDSTAADLVGEYVLASLAGSDPVAAVVAARRRFRHDRVVLVHGTVLADGLER